MPHLELNPVIEVNERGHITYFNEAAIDTLIRYSKGDGLKAFLPEDLSIILSRIPKADTCCISRTLQIGSATLVEHITLSGAFRVARISGST
jgi:hypothetical protein